MWEERRSGQHRRRSKQDHRLPFERDSTRVIHCPSFRRLQRKTQILGTDAGDFHRTRLTHSLEVASIGRSIVRNLAAKKENAALTHLLPNDDLINVICWLHDLGHPPFGHGGEAALNYMMRAAGGFEANAQTLRLVTKIENCYGSYGLDLTRRSLLGILKYPAKYSTVAAPLTKLSVPPCINDWLPPKGYFDGEQPEVDWLLAVLTNNDRDLLQSLATPPYEYTHGSTAYQSLDCSIMDAADNIAYGVHDLEDAIHLRLIKREQLDNMQLQELLAATRIYENYNKFVSALFDNKRIWVRKRAIGELVNYLITSTIIIPQAVDFANIILKYKVVLLPVANALLNYLKKSVYMHVINSSTARTFEHGGQTIICKLFTAINTNPVFLEKTKHHDFFQGAKEESAALRIICDYIANMTDEYANRLYQELFDLNLTQHEGICLVTPNPSSCES